MGEKNIKLTDNPLTNIKTMVPLLDEEGRKAFALMMYGYNMCNCSLIRQEKADNARKESEETGFRKTHT